MKLKKYIVILIFYFKKSFRIIREEGLSIFLTKAKRKVYRFVQIDYDLNAVPYNQYYDFSSADLIANKDVLMKFAKMKKLEIKTINWFIPHLTYCTGGPNTIFQFATFFQEEKGVRNNFIICNPTLKEGEKKEFENFFQKYFLELFGKAGLFYLDNGLNDIPHSDVSIATRWDTAYSVLKFNKTKAKFYFIQDFEPLFYPAGVKYALAEASYRFGFWGIANSPGLFKEYLNYSSNCTYFFPAVDRNIYYPTLNKMKKQKTMKIIFYGRPSSLRNGFELGIGSLRKIKSIYGDKVTIISLGEDWDERTYGVKGIVKNLGFLKSVKAVADLYRNSDIGVAFVFTKHPSYQPLEFMASGIATVTNYNSANLWFFKDKQNCLLAEPSESCVAEKISDLIENPGLREKIIKNGLETVNEFDWREGMEKAWQFMTLKKQN